MAVMPTKVKTTKTKSKDKKKKPKMNDRSQWKSSSGSSKGGYN